MSNLINDKQRNGFRLPSYAKATVFLGTLFAASVLLPEKEVDPMEADEQAWERAKNRAEELGCDIRPMRNDKPADCTEVEPLTAE